MLARLARAAQRHARGMSSPRRRLRVAQPQAPATSPRIAAVRAHSAQATHCVAQASAVAPRPVSAMSARSALEALQAVQAMHLRRASRAVLRPMSATSPRPARAAQRPALPMDCAAQERSVALVSALAMSPRHAPEASPHAPPIASREQAWSVALQLGSVMPLRSATARAPHAQAMQSCPEEPSVAPRHATAIRPKFAMARQPAAHPILSSPTAPTAAHAASVAQVSATNPQCAAAPSAPPIATPTEAARPGASRWSAPTKSPSAAAVRSPADPLPRCPTARPAAPVSPARTGSVAEAIRRESLRPQRPRAWHSAWRALCEVSERRPVCRLSATIESLRSFITPSEFAASRLRVFVALVPSARATKTSHATPADDGAPPSPRRTDSAPALRVPLSSHAPNDAFVLLPVLLLKRPSHLEAVRT